MKKILILLIILGTVSCKSKKTSTVNNRNNFMVETLAGLNAEEIKQAYPDSNFKEDVGMFEEGTEERAYLILYPDTADEIQITWADDEGNKINDIRFTEAGRWRSTEGIHIGTTYEELNVINKRPISFYGFGWDYSGAVVWNNGKLEDSNLRVFLAPQYTPEGKFYGDHIIEATAEEIKNLNLRVKTIIYKM